MNTNSGTVSEALSAQLHSTRTQIAILDFGSQYSHLIARRIREVHVFCELYSCLVDVQTLQRNNISGIILSGGPSSVYDPDSPHVREEVWAFIEEKKIPVLGICYGMQEITHKFGGVVSPSTEREFGRALVEKVNDDPSVRSLADLIFSGVEHSQMWMSHGDKVTKMPDGFVLIATTANSEFAAFASAERRMFGLQFHPEVTHSIHGKTLLQNFAVGVCGSPTDWNMTNVAEEFIAEVRQKVGDDRHVIGAVSGGVDSSVAAVLMHRAIGDRFHAVMVDNGCLRKDESAAVVLRLKEQLGINLRVVDASERFLSALAGVTEPERKRKIIGGLFIDVFQEEAQRLGKVDFLLQGTLYPDVIESVSYKGPSATIKTHHNVGGLPASMHLSLIEPLRCLPHSLCLRSPSTESSSKTK
jgi:GMP synthase (glutamine-hydrolysing)